MLLQSTGSVGIAGGERLVGTEIKRNPVWWYITHKERYDDKLNYNLE